VSWTPVEVAEEIGITADAVRRRGAQLSIGFPCTDDQLTNIESYRPARGFAKPEGWTTNVDYALERNLPICPYCLADMAKPCVSPNGAIRHPHMDREKESE